MKLSFTRRYWMTIAGGFVVAAIMVWGAFSIGSRTVGQLVDTTIRGKGDRFESFLVGNPDDLQALLTGLARDPDTETRVRTVAGLSDIDTFSIFDAAGNEVYRSRSDRYKWLLRDRAGGISSKDRLSVETLSRDLQGQVVENDQTDNPSAINRIELDGRTVAYVSITADLADDRYAFRSVLTTATLHLVAVIFVAAGLPALLYLRRKRRVEEADERIQFLANHDVLTNLLNRTRMQADTDRVLATSRATREQMAYFFLDIDGLAEINGDMGQAQGDELLRVVAQRLTRCLDRSDLLARIAADDFVFLHRRAGDEAEIGDLARRIATAVCEPVELSGGTVRPQVSIGVARMPENGRTHNELLKHAEMALLHHKAHRGGVFALYEPSMDAEMIRRRQIEAAVRQSLEQEAFELFYQPIVSGEDLQLVGFEALIRMPDGQGGYVSPAVFVPIAEARGYIQSIGTWVIREACRQIAEWPEHLYVSVNLSPVQFRDGDLAGHVEAALRSAGIPGRRLEVEIVESLVLDHSDGVHRQLEELKALGCSIAMDDFGTGYSSLSYLWRFAFDKLKVDQSFMKAHEAGEPNVARIVETIVTMAHHMKMKVTAEGVETVAQVDLLRQVGCDFIQGYRFGRPMPARDAAAEIMGTFARRSRDGTTDAARPADTAPALRLAGAQD